MEEFGFSFIPYDDFETVKGCWASPGIFDPSLWNDPLKLGRFALLMHDCMRGRIVDNRLGMARISDLKLLRRVWGTGRVVFCFGNFLFFST